MIEFQEGNIPGKRLTTLTAYISQIDLMQKGKEFLQVVIKRLIEQLVTVHRLDLENIVTEYTLSKECREYVQSKTREEIDKAIQLEIKEMFGKRE